MTRMKNHTIALSRRKKLERELKYLRTFFLCVGRWSNVDIVVRGHLADLMADAEVEFGDASFDMENAEQQGDDQLIEVYSELEEKIAKFRPKMRDAYAYLSHYCFHACSPVNDIELWKRIFRAVYKSLDTVTLVGPLKREVESFNEDLGTLRSYLRFLTSYLSTVTSLKEFWVYLGGVATCGAYLSYLCWVDGDGKDPIRSQDLIDLVSDLHSKIKPCNCETINVYFGLFKAFGSINSHYVVETVNEFMEEWVSVNDQTANVRSGLNFLIRFLICAPNEFSDEVKFIGFDIQSVLAKAVTLSSLAGNKKEFYLLLGRIEILKAESVLMGLMNKSLENQTTAAVKIKNKKHTAAVKSSEALLKGVKILQTFSKQPPRGITDKGKSILIRIEAMVNGLASLYDTVNEDAIRDVLKFLVNIKLLKAQVFWLELLDMNTISMENIEAILEGLECLREIVSGSSKSNPQSGKLILSHVDEVACKAMSSYHIIHHAKDEGAENLDEEMEKWISELAHMINLAKAEAETVDVRVCSSLCFDYPKTDGLGSLDFCLENLRKLLNSYTNFGSSVKHLIESVLIKDLESLRSFICDTAKQCNQANQESEILHKRIIDMAYEADHTIDSIVLRNGDVWCHTYFLSDVIEEIKRIKAEVAETDVKKTYAVDETVHVPVPVPVTQTRRDKSGPLIKEVIVSLKDEEHVIINQLTRGSERREIVSIVGMGGIGKTTLAKEVFKDHEVKEHFIVRAWCSVSETYKKRDLLLEILRYVPKLDAGCSTKVRADHDEFDKDTDDDIAHKLSQRLMGRKYLIVMDDMWDIQAYNDMRMSFPEDSNGSRILFTSRDSKIISKAGGASEPHPLRGLSETESWKLLKAKVFHGKDCPQELVGIGSTIATGCNGLPIALIAIGGLLERTEKTLGWWKEVAEDINAHIAEDSESRCMSILGLSYKHLPSHLKPCFLYFSAFLGNKEILVQKLLRLWIAEGFVRNVDLNVSIEDIAETYLEDLISRSLVIVTKERSQGGLKACLVHDTLRELCKNKAEEDNFLQQIKGYDIHFPPSSSIYVDYGVRLDYSSPSITYKQHRLSIHTKRNHLAMLKPSGPLVRSLLFFPTTDSYPRCPYDVSFISNNFKLLRVLDLEDVNMGTSFPSGIELLKRLRYLALSGDIDSVPSTLAELWSLETLCVNGLKGQVVIPDDILDMESLRHLYVKDTAVFRLQESESKKLCKLVTLSSTSLSCGEFAEKLMKRLLNIKKLKCIIVKPHDHSVCKRSPMLSFLTKIESLKVCFYDANPPPCAYHLGPSLRKLAIRHCHLSRERIYAIGGLPKLQVLKLISVALDDQKLDMSQYVFDSLRYLKLEDLAISEWNADSDHFPVLERLVLRKCKKLKEVPSSFEESATLQTIELQWCSQSAESSVKDIQKEQYESGNNKFRLFIDLLEWDHLSS